MKVKYLLIALLFIAAGCSNSNKKQSANGASETKEGEGYWQKLVMNEFLDNKGLVLATSPYPADWEMMKTISPGGPVITGPHGIKVFNFPLQSYTYYYDYNMRQISEQSGQRMRQMPGVEQVIEEDLVPWCAKKGLTFVKQYELPEISKIDKWYSDQLYQAMPRQTQILAIATEWKREDGTPYFLLMHLNVSDDRNVQGWYYMCTGLEAETSHYEIAKKQLIFGLVNTHYNLEPIAAYNKEEAQRVGASWASFNQRMAQNQANFEASQRAFVNKSNAINETIMNGWRERNASSDRQHEQTIDVITERTNVVDPTTGQKYKVSSGANQYWMNSNGEYISTEHHDYDPNLDDNMNRERWQELKEVK